MKTAPKPAPAHSGPAAERSQDASLSHLITLAESRIAIEGVDPEIDGGRFPAKTVVGERLIVEADIFGDGHETFDAALLYREGDEDDWREAPLTFVINDRWRGELTFSTNGPAAFTIIAWRDLFSQWAYEIRKKITAGQTVTLELTEGRHLVEAAIKDPRDGAPPQPFSDALAAAETNETLQSLLLSDEVASWMKQAAPRTNLTRYDKELPVWVDRKAAAFSAWYELMPRSMTNDETRHGTFRDVIDRLPYVRDLGFDVLYFTPIHPIGKTNRKGRNNTLTPGPDDVGSPYAIGSADGGHDAVHPELGTIEDFNALVAAAHEHGLEIALDFAIQCSPDHPWIKEHPEWFDWRPDGTIKFAENPPKKYEDIVNVHFYRDAIPGLWYALRDVVLYWVEHGVKIFRVDNPHTKPFPFWEWMIAEIHVNHPDVIFLAEAFTRPKVMKRLAKVGYSQSYSYFTWRNEKWELEQYLTELTTKECRHFMRPNFFANTPDINPLYLQTSGRAGFRTRLVLAATLAGNYGIYNGYEICDAAPMPGKEEYLNSEKYQIRIWDMDQPGNIQDDIRLVNRLRRENPALQSFTSLKFFRASNDQVLYYGKFDHEAQNYLLFHVNLDPHHVQATDFELPLWAFDLPDEASLEVEDLLHGNHFTWHGKSHWLELDPQTRPYAIWRLYPPGAPRPENK